ncbi:MAG: hypothetical protein MK081_14680 [Flavobacteriales bacterium]|nr:hypothetical protein [Flavobacteriales bacterium]
MKADMSLAQRIMSQLKAKDFRLLHVAFGLLVVKYGLFYADYDTFHAVVDLATLFFYLTILLWLTKLFIRKKKPLLGNLSILLMLVFILELVFFFLLGMPKKEWKSYDTPDLEENHIGRHLGHVPWADSVWHDVKTAHGKTIFDAHYSIDKLHRRITPGYDKAKDKYAVFFGCSVCFGFGLQDDQTIPYYIQENTTSYNAYNYAYSGWGCNHMLARLEHKDLSKEVNEQQGIGIYVFIWSHIRRAISDMRIYTSWGHTMPYYYLEDNEIKRDGNFANGRVVTSTFYEYLDKSYTSKYFELNMPIETTEDHMILAAEIIKEAKSTYTKQFSNDNFVVLIHPTDWVEFTPEKNNQFKSLLEARGIEYLDYSEILVLDNEHIIIGDGHPNEKSNQELAKMVVKDLNLK